MPSGRLLKVVTHASMIRVEVFIGGKDADVGRLVITYGKEGDLYCLRLLMRKHEMYFKLFNNYMT